MTGVDIDRWMEHLITIHIPIRIASSRILMFGSAFPLMGQHTTEHG
jgi:hypothetical protein